MKKILSLIIILITLSSFSQIPPYYNDVNLEQSGLALKDELATKIISTHTTNISYTPGVWNALKQTDIDPTDASKVVLIYGWDDSDSDITNDRTRDKDLHGSGSGVWNREHVYSKSLANPNLGTSGPGADAHNLRPCDAQRNSSRSNRKFEDGTGNSGITAAGNWYPGNEWKGDVARMMMYMYIRYGNQTLPTGVTIGTVNVTDANMINLLLAWNAEDPVSILELQRNPVLEEVQGNRNPFIDNPAFATQIWGGPQAEDKFGNGNETNDTVGPSAPSNLSASNTTQSSVALSWTASTDNTAVTDYTIFNKANQVGTTSNTNFIVSNLSSATSYSFSVKAYDAALNVSAKSNIVSITTVSNENGATTELLISEYIEGSSNNKAIEIANFTGATVDLSAYSLRKATNGSGSFSSNLALNGTLANGQVYVIAHASADTNILNVADLTNNGVLSFNGNDAVGLFKNDVLIDLLGNASSSANFAQNVTLQRKASVNNPNTSYTVAEWNSLATDTFNGLGSHTIDTVNADTAAPSAPANLAVSNVTQTTADLDWSASTDNTAVAGYDVYQDSEIIASVTEINYSVTGLTVATSYNFYVKAKDEAENISNESDVLNVTTQSAPSRITTSDLLISEYIEGSSNNKAIEIANFTGKSVDLASYALKKATNGAGSFSSVLNLTGTLADEQVYVIANTRASGAILNVSDETNGSVLTFNGNDAVGLFKNDVLIDLIGNEYSSSNFAKDVTLQRKVSVIQPSTTYTVTEWNSFAQNTFEGLGTHFINNEATSSSSARSSASKISIAANEPLPSKNFMLYPNPVTGNLLTVKLQSLQNKKSTFKISNILGQLLLNGVLINNTININTLKKGIYFLEINDNKLKVVKKFVKN
jgi:endonuclease I/chitodextrinase